MNKIRHLRGCRFHVPVSLQEGAGFRFYFFYIFRGRQAPFGDPAEFVGEQLVPAFPGDLLAQSGMGAQPLGDFGFRRGGN